ncbi:MAG: hypothetical protein L6Q37_09875 [Bdellovibrionaceae bacterium]|nr:hypothetical protein [Pseudobdellovibrionaceae bacterium]NUM57604.1 hypothetical protein [Pseudobdellovibrionaceae bacterium]
MKKILAAVAMSLVGFSAMAEVYVPYNQWTYLPHCGGYTKLVCPDVSNAKQTSQCEIKFSESYNCNRVKLYVGYDYYPKLVTSEVAMQGSFYVDYSKINKLGSDNFRTYMYSTSTDTYEQVYYQFNY